MTTHHTPRRPGWLAAFAALLLAVAPFQAGLANSQTLIFNDFCTSTINNLPAA